MSTHKMIAGCFVCLLGGAISKVYAQASINGTVSGIKEKVLYMSVPVADSFRNDTIHIKDGKFTWKGKVPGPYHMTMFGENGVYEFFIENKPMRLKINKEGYHLSGSPVNDEYEAYRNGRADMDKAFNDAATKEYYAKDSSDEVKAALSSAKQVADNALVKYNNDYITNHRSSYVSLMLIGDRAAIDARHQEIDSLFHLLSENLQSSKAGKDLTKQIAILRKRSEGQPFIDFTQKDIEGKTVHFNDLKGKYILVDFWASWCGPCRAENPNVLKAYQQYKDKNFTVVGISLDKEEAKWKKAVADDKMPWLQLSDLEGFENEVATYYNIRAIPFSFLLDPQGKIIARGLRGEELQQKLFSLLH